MICKTSTDMLVNRLTSNSRGSLHFQGSYPVLILLSCPNTLKKSLCCLLEGLGCHGEILLGHNRENQLSVLIV
jgi:hypothetical protein